MSAQDRICIVSSCGGHLTEMRAIRSAYEKKAHFYVLNDAALLPPDMVDRTYFITHSERDTKLLLNLWEAARILRRERPSVILSTGAGPVVPFAILARTLFPAKVIFIETITRISAPSLTGRIMYYLAHEFFYQWPQLAQHFPKGRYYGSVIE